MSLTDHAAASAQGCISLAIDLHCVVEDSAQQHRLFKIVRLLLLA